MELRSLRRCPDNRRVWLGQSSVAAEISYLLEQRRQPFALLDLDYLGWGGSNFDDHRAGFGLMLRNLAAVASNYREAGVGVFIVAYFIRDHEALAAVREATASLRRSACRFRCQPSSSA